MPDYLLPSNSADIRRAVDLFVNKFVSEYLQDYGKLYREDQAHANSYNYDYQVRTTTQVGADNVLFTPLQFILMVEVHTASTKPW